MSAASYRVVGIGAVLLDHIAVLPSFPAEHSKVPMLPAGPLEPRVGGPTPVKLLNLAKIGCASVFLGTVGDDFGGQLIRRALLVGGVNLDGVVTQIGRRSGFAHVWVNTDEGTGTRTIAYSTGTLEPLVLREQQCHDLLAGAAALLVDAREPLAAKLAMRMARQRGVLVVLDTGSFRAYTGELIRCADIVQAPWSTARQLTGADNFMDAARQLHRFGPRIAVVTDGPRGAAYASAEQEGMQPAFPISTVDSSGAGDVFGAGLIYALLMGRNTADSVAFAAASAALKCKQWEMTVLSSRADVDQFLAAASRP